MKARVTILWAAMAAASTYVHAIENALTKPQVQSSTQTFNISGTFDFDAGKLRLDRGTCPPAGTLCDASNETGQIFVCTDVANYGVLYTCVEAAAGWKINAAAGVGGSGNSFETLDAPAGTDPVADSATDTLLLAVGGPVTITGNAALDKLTFDVTTSPAAAATVVGTGRTLTTGAGIGGGGDLSADRALATASGETDFLASGALTCGASTQGKVQVHTTPLQYCDNAATPALQYAAYGSSSGVATSATALAANGANCSGNNFALGVDASGVGECAQPDVSNLSGLPVAIAQGGTGQTTATAAFNALDPLTTKGDLVVHDGTNSVRVAVGADGARLVADSSQAAGAKWLSPSQPSILYAPIWQGANSDAVTADNCHEYRWTVSTRSGPFTRARINIQTASTSAIWGFGIYSKDGGLKYASCQGNDGSTTGEKTCTLTSFVLEEGEHVFAFCADVATTNYRGHGPSLNVVGNCTQACTDCATTMPSQITVCTGAGISNMPLVGLD